MKQGRYRASTGVECVTFVMTTQAAAYQPLQPVVSQAHLVVELHACPEKPGFTCSTRQEISSVASAFEARLADIAAALATYTYTAWAVRGSTTNWYIIKLDNDSLESVVEMSVPFDSSYVSSACWDDRRLRTSNS